MNLTVPPSKEINHVRLRIDLIYIKYNTQVPERNTKKFTSGQKQMYSVISKHYSSKEQYIPEQISL